MNKQTLYAERPHLFSKDDKLCQWQRLTRPEWLVKSIFWGWLTNSPTPLSLVATGGEYCCFKSLALTQARYLLLGSGINKRERERWVIHTRRHQQDTAVLPGEQFQAWGRVSVLTVPLSLDCACPTASYPWTAFVDPEIFPLRDLQFRQAKTPLLGAESD